MGVKNIYKELERKKNVKVRMHGHDRNASVNKDNQLLKMQMIHVTLPKELFKL